MSSQDSSTPEDAEEIAQRWVDLFESDHIVIPAPQISRKDLLTVARALLASVAVSEKTRLEMPSQGEILLACGELKATELRAVKAALAWFIGRLNG